MKRIYAEQINNLLESYHFNVEFMGGAPALAFNVLHNGIQHLYGAAFCSGDIETTEQLKPLLMQIIDGEIPQPLHPDNFAQECVL